jgi:hypothetical protein
LEMLFGVLSVLRHSSAPAFSLIFIWSGQYTCVARQNLADSWRPGTRDFFFLPLIRYRVVQQGSQEMWFEKKTGQQLTYLVNLPSRLQFCYVIQHYVIATSWL